MLVTVATRLKTFIVSLNLFNSESEDPNVERLERISTRIYLVLLTISFIILLTYTSVVERTSTITVDSPSQTIIEQLFEEYSESINCPCTNIAISYDKIIQVDVTYHQICSSPLLTSEWIKNAYLANTTYIWPRDIRTLASMYAQIFASFCSISKAQMDVGLSTFKSSPLITTNVIKSSLLSTQIQTHISIFNQTITEDINTLHTGIQVTTRGNQLASGLQTANVWYISQSDDEDMILTPETIWYQYDQVTEELGCFCDTITYCTVQTYFYPDVDYYSLAHYGRSTYDGINHPIEIDGWATGCYPMQGLYATKLNCYYNRTCLALLFDSSLESIPVLRFESNQTRFGSPNRYTTKTLMRNLFVENFHVEVFFDKFLQECAPRFCTYTLTHKANILQIISTIFGLFGGISTALKLFVQQILLRFLNWRYKRTLTRGTNQGNNLVRTGLTWNSFQRLSSMVRNKIVELNLFSENSIIGRENIERQRWTTRLFVLSLAIAFSTLTIYTALGEHTKMIIISSPNQSHYKNLLMFHPSIRCPCASISIKYEQFLNTSPSFHQICSSDFQNWNFYQWLNVNASLDTRDFRFSAVSYFALLAHLCAQVEITVEESYNHFIKNEYITDILLTPELFSIEASTLINTLIQKTVNQFVQITQTTRQLTAASHFISKYQTSSSSIVTPDY